MMTHEDQELVLTETEPHSEFDEGATMNPPPTQNPPAQNSSLTKAQLNWMILWAIFYTAYPFVLYAWGGGFF